MDEEKKTTKKTTRKTTRRSSKKEEGLLDVVDKVETIEEPVEVPEAAPEKKSKAAKKPTIKLAKVIPDEGLKVRTGPGLNFPKLPDRLKKNEQVEILEEKGDFVRIGWNQWCMSYYLEIL